MIDRDRVSSLPRLAPPVLTAYLDTNPANPRNKRRPAGYLIWLKTHGKALAKEVAEKERRAFSEQWERLLTHLEANPPLHRGVVVFAGPRAWEVFHLQVDVTNELHWGEPAFAQLLWLMDEHRVSAAAVVNRAGMRLYRSWMGEVEQQMEMSFEIDRSTWRQKHLMPPSNPGVLKNRGTERDRFDERMKVHYQRLLRDGVKNVVAWAKKQRAHPVVIAGPNEMAEMAWQELPAEFRQQAVLLRKDLAYASAAELAAQIAPVVREWERAHEKDLVERLLDAGRDGAVVGMEATLGALQAGRARKVVIARGLSRMLRRCRECGVVGSSTQKECPECGGRREAVALRAVLPELARRFQVPVEVVAGDAAGKLLKAGGVGAALRELG